MKSDQRFSDVVNRRDFVLPDQLAELKERTGRLNNYICRQVRKYKVAHHSNKINIFSVSPKGYAYENGGVSLTTKTPRKRVFIPLTDHNQYDRQLTVELKSNRLILYAPIDVKVKKHTDYVNEIGIAWGYFVMFTTSTENRYGEEYGQLRSRQIEQMNESNAAHQRMLHLYKKHMDRGDFEKANNIRANNLGRQKYERGKSRNDQVIRNYINAEINRMLRSEKPAVIYLPKLPPATGFSAAYYICQDLRLRRKSMRISMGQGAKFGGAKHAVQFFLNMQIICLILMYWNTQSYGWIQLYWKKRPYMRERSGRNAGEENTANTNTGAFADPKGGEGRAG